MSIRRKPLCGLLISAAMTSSLVAGSALAAPISGGSATAPGFTPLTAASSISSLFATSALASPLQSRPTRQTTGPRMAPGRREFRCRGTYDQNTGVSFSFDGVRSERTQGTRAIGFLSSDGTRVTFEVTVYRRGGEFRYRANGPAPGNHGASTLVLVDDSQFRSQEAFQNAQNGTFATARFNFADGQPTIGSFRWEERRNGRSVRVTAMHTCWSNPGHDPDPAWRAVPWNPNMTVHPSLIRPPSPYAVNRDEVIGYNGN